MLNIDWSKLSNPSYWLEGSNIGQVYDVPVIDTKSPFFYFFIILFGGLIVASILINLTKLFVTSKNPLQPKLSILATNFGWMGFLGMLWFGLRELQVSFLSSRLWLLLGIFWFLIIIGYLVQYYFRFYKYEMNYFRSQLLVANDNHKPKKSSKITKVK